MYSDESLDTFKFIVDNIAKREYADEILLKEYDITYAHGDGNEGSQKANLLKHLNCFGLIADKADCVAYDARNHLLKAVGLECLVFEDKDKLTSRMFANMQQEWETDIDGKLVFITPLSAAFAYYIHCCPGYADCTSYDSLFDDLKPGDQYKRAEIFVGKLKEYLGNKRNLQVLKGMLKVCTEL